MSEASEETVFLQIEKPKEERSRDLKAMDRDYTDSQSVRQSLSEWTKGKRDERSVLCSVFGNKTLCFECSITNMWLKQSSVSWRRISLKHLFNSLRQFHQSLFLMHKVLKLLNHLPHECTSDPETPDDGGTPLRFQRDVFISYSDFKLLPTRRLPFLLASVLRVGQTSAGTGKG